jgi:uncharacterized protein YjeT (DUF2065 family)
MVGRAQAVEIVRSGSIPAGQTIDDDVIIGGDQVRIDGTVNGNLIAGGQTITVNGTIKSDAILFGQTVVIGEKAVIEGNLFAGAANVTVRGKVQGTVFGGAATMVVADQANVGRNLFFGGYALETKPAAQVGRDLYAAGYQVILGGSTRNVEIGASAIELRGTINGNATLWVSEPGATGVDPTKYWQSNVPDMPASIQPGLRIAESAKITGKLTYTSQTEQAGAIQTAPGGGVVYQTPDPTTSRSARQIQPQVEITRRFMGWEGFWLWGLLRNLATILILGGLGLWLAPRIFHKAVAQLQQRSLASLAVGLLMLVAALFAIPVVTIALVVLGLIVGLTTLVDVTGIIFGVGFASLGLAVTVFFTLFLWAGKLVLAFIIGDWLLKRVAPQSVVHPFGALALGALIFASLAAIPLVGFFFTFLADLAGLGALWYAWKIK